MRTTVAMLALVAAACSKPAAPPPAATLTDRAAAEFAKTLADRLRTSTPLAICTELFDEDGLFEKSYDGIRASSSARSAARRGMLHALDRHVGRLAELAKANQLHFVKVRQVGDERRLVFRASDQDLSVKYYELVVILKNGQVRIADIHLHSMGGRFSDVVRETHAGALVTSGDIQQAFVPTDVRAFANHHKTLESMRTAFANGAFGEAMKLYEQLPAFLRHRRSIMFLRINSVPEGAMADLIEGLDALEKQHPDDVGALQLMLKDVRLMQDLPRALGLVERLDRAIGGDPHVHMQRCQAHMSAGDLSTATVHLRRMIEADPGHEKAHRLLLGISLARRDYQAVPKLADAIEAKFGWASDDVRRTPAWSEFMKSAEYQQWKQGK